MRTAFERIRAFLSSSPRQTFVGFPIAVVLFETLTHRRAVVRRRWLPLLALGYALYYGAGEYRERKAAGTRGFERPPDKLLTDGPYALSRNPMYLGHLVFMAALVGATRSRLAVLLAVRQYLRFGERVAIDERRLAEKFGDEYRDYVARVPRWVGAPKASSSATRTSERDLS